jgi:hypothetical protein
MQDTPDVEHKRRRGNLAWLMLPNLEMPTLFLFGFEVTNKKTMNCFFKGVILNPRQKDSKSQRLNHKRLVRPAPMSLELCE